MYRSDVYAAVFVGFHAYPRACNRVVLHSSLIKYASLLLARVRRYVVI